MDQLFESQHLAYGFNQRLVPILGFLMNANRVASSFEEIPPINIYAIFCIVGIGSLASEHEAMEVSPDSDKTSCQSSTINCTIPFPNFL